MNKYLLWIAVIIVIAAVALFFTKKTEAPSKTVAENVPTAVVTKTAEVTSAPVTANVVAPTVSTATVTYTNDGFVPDLLTVKSGTKVTFINQNDSPMWVASGPHPAHTLYPEFDAKVAVPKGGSYSFIFTKVGTHPYHNHVLLGKFGKVVVE